MAAGHLASTVLREALELGLLREPELIEMENGAAARGKLLVPGRGEATIVVALSEAFPVDLPRILLVPWNQLGFIPHVAPDGTVCFSEREGLLLDIRRPLDIVRESLERTSQLLIDGASGANAGDFVEEFEWYWRQTECRDVLSVLIPDDKIDRILLVESEKNGTWVCRSAGDIAAFFNQDGAIAISRVRDGLFVPLEPGCRVLPPRPDRAFWTTAELRDKLLPCLSPSNKARLKRVFKRDGPSPEVVIFSLPRKNGGETLFGVEYHAPGKRHPLQDKGTAQSIQPIRVTRLDKKYLKTRGGGNATLDEKRVIVVGCGAIGGRIAVELARSGVGTLALVDDERLAPENTFRHVLGRQSWTKYKTDALKSEIESEIPYVNVIPFTRRIEEVIRNAAIDLSHYDLLISAVGDATVELKLNEQLGRAETPAAIFTWLEPLGIGGHALLVGGRAPGGCLECLYTSLDDVDAPFENRASFAAAGQRFGRDLSGCGSVFTPYGSLDAQQTATLAVRLALDYLLQVEGGNPLRSWKGERLALEAAGFRVSARYGLGLDELRETSYAYANPRCRICGNRSPARADR